MSELSICFKCGGTARFERILDNVRVYCMHCQERTPWYATDSEAVEAWNTGKRYKVKGCIWTPRCDQISCAECLGFVKGDDEGYFEHRTSGAKWDYPEWVNLDREMYSLNKKIKDMFKATEDKPLMVLPHGDAVHSPAHYCKGRKYEPWDVIKDWDLDFDLGCTVKYISRAGRKGDRLEDLKKAREYLDHEIRSLEGEE